jgi:hypothetical protein
MTTLIQARDSYLAALRSSAALKAADVTVSTHGGTFDLAELQRYSKVSPGAVLSLLAFSADCTEGYIKCEARWGVFCFSENRPALPRDVGAMATAEAVSLALLLGFVDLDVEHKPQQVEARNWFDAPKDMKDVAMWLVEFSSEFELSDAVDANAQDLSGVDAKWDLYPRDNDAPLGEIPEAEDSVSTL